MVLKFEVFIMHLLEVMFFIGLSGCTVAVILSWISVVKGCFTDET